MPYKEKGLMRPAADLTVYHIIGEEMLKIQTILTPRAFWGTFLNRKRLQTY